MKNKQTNKQTSDMDIRNHQTFGCFIIFFNNYYSQFKQLKHTHLSLIKYILCYIISDNNNNIENCFGKKKQTKTIIIFNEKQSYHQQTVMAKVKKQEIEKNKKLT